MPEDGYPLGRGFLPALRADQFDDAPVIIGPGAFVSATTGTFPTHFAHTGIAFATNQDEKVAVPVFAPVAWETVTISLLGLAESFGSGAVKLRLGSEQGTNDVTIDVAGSYVGELGFAVPPTWTPASGAFADYQFAQVPLSRIVHTNGGLDENFAVLALAFTEGS